MEQLLDCSIYLIFLIFFITGYQIMVPPNIHTLIIMFDLSEKYIPKANIKKPTKTMIFDFKFLPPHFPLYISTTQGFSILLNLQEHI